MQVETHLELLGLFVEDAVTGYKGVVTSVSFELYGCVQAVVTPPLDKDGKIVCGNWFDVTRLIVQEDEPVMKTPDFSAGYVAEGRKGCDVLKPMP